MTTDVRTVLRELDRAFEMQSGTLQEKALAKLRACLAASDSAPAPVGEVVGEQKVGFRSQPLVMWFPKPPPIGTKLYAERAAVPARHPLGNETARSVEAVQRPLPPEVRLNTDGSLDEVVGTGAFHLEQMGDNLWWMRLDAPGRSIVVWMRAKGKIKARAEDEPPLYPDRTRRPSTDLAAQLGSKVVQTKG